MPTRLFSFILGFFPKAKPMIASMTGFSSVSREWCGRALAFEIRSVNQRYLDLQMRLPDELRFAEPLIRERVSAEISRGKIECRVAISGGSGSGAKLDTAVLERLADLDRRVREAIPGAASLSVSEVLAMPGVFGHEDFSQEELKAAIGELLAEALADFTASRRREGEKLSDFLKARMAGIRERMESVRPRLPGLIDSFRDRLVSRLEEAGIDPDDERIRHELTLFASRIDVDEELSRLGAHLDEMDRILARGGAAGKRLDFLMQELNREANTLGSKSVDLEISRAAMDLKVLIEQMREQIQNIE